MKKCTLCVDRIYNDTLPEEDRDPACVRACPTGRAAFRRFGRSSADVSRLVAERGGIDLMPEMGYKPVNKYLPPRPKTPARATAPSAASRRPRCRRLTASWAGSTPRSRNSDNPMHPAVSVIFFTVTSGAGLGMIFLLGLGFPVRLAQR
jgi:hypothetical protein